MCDVKGKYQLIKEIKCTSNYWCSAINSDNTLLALGGYKIINIYSLKSEEMKLIYTLNEHTQIINSIKFYNQNIIVSGSAD